MRCANVGARRIPAAKTAESKLVMVVAWLLDYLVSILCCPVAASKRKFCRACRIFMDKFMYKNKLYCVFLCSVCFFDLFGCITLIMYHDAWSAIPSSTLKFLQVNHNFGKWLQHVAAKSWKKMVQQSFWPLHLIWNNASETTKQIVKRWTGLRYLET